MKTLFWILLIALFIGCKQNKSEGSKETETEKKTLALKQKVEISREQVVLLPEAQEITNQWLAYITAQSEMENFKNYTLNNVISNATPISEIMNSLKGTVPARLNSNAVQARLGVLETKAKILKQLTEKREVNPEEISKTAKEIPLEFNNFKIQINELFQKTLEEFEEELDEIEDENENEKYILIQKSKKPVKKLTKNFQKEQDSI